MKTNNTYSLNPIGIIPSLEVVSRLVGIDTRQPHNASRYSETPHMIDNTVISKTAAKVLTAIRTRAVS